MRQHDSQLSDFSKHLYIYFHTNKDRKMRYINELAPHTSEWDFLSECSRQTKSRRDYFVDRCSHLERLFHKLGLPLTEFYWFTHEDELELELRIDIKKFIQFKKSAPLIKGFLEKYFPIDDLGCLDDIKVWDPSIRVQPCFGSYVRVFENRVITIRLKINDYGYNYYFPSAIYLDACLHYA